jgi:hypothetical protein
VLIPPRIRGIFLLLLGLIQNIIPRRKHLATVELHSWEVVDLDDSDSEDYTPDLIDVLRNRKISATISQYLHFEDIINLAVFSVPLRASLFPGPDTSKRREVLRVSSCTKGQKKQCWTCGIQICTVGNNSFFRMATLFPDSSLVLAANR